MFGLRPLRIDWLPFPPRHFLSEGGDFISHGRFRSLTRERGAGCRRRQGVALNTWRRVREERSGRTGKLSTQAKNEEEDDGRERKAKSEST